MKICMVGAGHVGLVAAACFADFGWQVTCVEKDDAKLELLRAGGVSIYEPGLEDLLARNRAAGRISFTNDLARDSDGVVVLTEWNEFRALNMSDVAEVMREGRHQIAARLELR